MANSITNVFETLKSKMGGATFLMKYHFIHFCVKSDPAVLLACDVNVDEEEQPIEEVADIVQPNDSQLIIIPKEPQYLIPICEAVLSIHPEYKIEKEELDTEPEPDVKIKPEDGGNELNFTELKGPVLFKKPIVLFCTMPEMDEERRDAGIDYVKVNFDSTIAKLDFLLADSIAKLSKILIKESDPSYLDNYKKQLEHIYGQHKVMCETMRKEKETEIEEAFQYYQEKEKLKTDMLKKESDAKGEQASHSMKIDPFLQD